MQYQPNDQFQDLPLKFEKGVAAIDVVTLRGAGNAIEPYLPSRNVVLPPLAEYEGEASFEDLMQITVNPNDPSVVAIIDTTKMTWKSELNPERSAFDDYTNTSKRAVSFGPVGIVNHQEASITQLPIVLEDGRDARMWFAEIPQAKLVELTTYGLFTLAKEFVAVFTPEVIESYDVLKIPAQQIDYMRTLEEILSLNPELEDAKQKFKVALDETGARVYVETRMLAGGMPPQFEPEPKVAVFGSNGPVLFWLTEPDENKALTPFAIVATTSKAWLDPNQEIDFSLGL
jgi:hypothetical protein